MGCLPALCSSPQVETAEVTQVASVSPTQMAQGALQTDDSENCDSQGSPFHFRHFGCVLYPFASCSACTHAHFALRSGRHTWIFAFPLGTDKQQEPSKTLLINNAETLQCTDDACWISLPGDLLLKLRKLAAHTKWLPSKGRSSQPGQSVCLTHFALLRHISISLKEELSHLCLFLAKKVACLYSIYRQS